MRKMRQKSKSESVQEYEDQVLLDAILIYGLEGAHNLPGSDPLSDRQFDAAGE